MIEAVDYWGTAKFWASEVRSLTAFCMSLAIVALLRIGKTKADLIEVIFWVSVGGRDAAIA